MATGLTLMKSALAAALLGLAAAPASANASLEVGLAASTDQGLKGFYRTRDNRPLWTVGGAVHASARTLVDIVGHASLDGLDNGVALAAQVEAAIARAASGSPGDLADAELLLSRTWVDYVKTLRRPVNVGMIYAEGSISPAAPFTAQILNDAAAARDLAAHLRTVSELNPVYSQLRAGLAAWRNRDTLALDRGSVVQAGLSDADVEQRFLLNLDRARALPLSPDGSFILVDTASARVFLYENGRVRDSMKVVVGKSAEQTPMVAGIIRHAVLNPYWNVPPDLVRKKAVAALENGSRSLSPSFELLGDWSATPRPLDGKSVDWEAVAAGRQELRVRQRPGAGNAMGAMKFTFANDFGIYLHDTPDKALFGKTDRRLSSGCIRVEDARRLASWIFGRVPSTTSTAPEQVVPADRPMPVYVTYLTAGWDGQRIALTTDGYLRDVRGSRPATSQNARGISSLR